VTGAARAVASLGRARSPGAALLIGGAMTSRDRRPRAAQRATGSRKLRPRQVRSVGCRHEARTSGYP